MFTWALFEYYQRPGPLIHAPTVTTQISLAENNVQYRPSRCTSLIYTVG